eukprot:scaffold2426_cov65-Cyclotella_meneghiniana.AAC.3
MHPPNIVCAWISAPLTQQLDCPQCLIMGIINGMTGFRLDFIVYNGLNNTTFESRIEGMTGFRLDLIFYNALNNTTFESRVGDIAKDPHYLSTQDYVCLDQCTLLDTAA